MENGKSKVEASVHRFETVNDIVEGKLVAIRKGEFGNGVYDIETENGRVTVFGTKVLDSLISPDHIDKTIRIIYRGVVLGKNGFAYKKFEVSTEERCEEW
ncbi:MAG TPA: hypothetical protein VJ044_19110 [Candidatus Hodarchaeales archaeon]|nr:hypothetical protein [Candidatus Hodarchaeales archaeon]